MALVDAYFSAFLTDRLEATDVYLPLVPAATAELLSLLPNADDYIFLSLKGDTNFETVIARNEGGTILLERGIGVTPAVLHHYGTCLSAVSPTILAVIRDQICNFSACCDGGDCPCTPVAYEGALLPQGNAGVAWSGAAMFSGDMPMKLVANSTPSWMTVRQVGNTLELTGTPTASGTFVFSVGASNCNGTGTVTQSLEVVINT